MMLIEHTDSVVRNLENEEVPLEKLKTLLYVAQEQIVSEDVIDAIHYLLYEHEKYPKIWGLFGYTISDFAYATLAWLHDSTCQKEFTALFGNLTIERKKHIYQLIQAKPYLIWQIS